MSASLRAVAQAIARHLEDAYMKEILFVSVDSRVGWKANLWLK